MTIYEVDLFKKEGFVRKKCQCCGRNFWTLNADDKFCGDQPCVCYSFLAKPPTKSSYDMATVREMFLSFFERNGHKRIKKYPVVARWRDDVFLVGASIYNFQPWVTEGIVPPPANPLTISQPSIRLTDVDLVGKTGRHLTEFEMMADHAFNSPKEKIYWNNETVDYCHEFFTKYLGIKPEKLNYVESMWAGGGNAGENFEVVIDGIEVATLVFMHYRTEDDKLIPIDNLTVDTGYGLERIVWLSKGSPTIYDAVFEPVVQKLFKLSGYRIDDEKIFREASKLSGRMEVKGEAGFWSMRVKIAREIGIGADELNKIMRPVENIYAIADHTRTLVFMLGDGIVPSNIEAGYLARLLIRRTLRSMAELNLKIPLSEIIATQIAELSRDFPEYKEKSKVILEMVDGEEKKYKSTIERGKNIVSKLIEKAREKGEAQLSIDELIQLYDSQGLTPEIVSSIAEKQRFKVEIPDDFFSRVAKLHEKATKVAAEALLTVKLKEKIGEVESTRTLYYEDPFTREFDASVQKVIENKYVVLDQTAFYPEGGGQPGDRGILKFNGGEASVIDCQKIGNIIVHVCEGASPKLGEKVHGSIDWARRQSLMRHHTSTHILMGAVVRVLGEHAWQSGAQKDVDRSRLDISHFERLTPKQVHEIERLANEVVMAAIPVETSWQPRQVAESKYGFRLYQGGVVPGKEIRVVKIGEWDAEACGGVHCKSTAEVGIIKIIKTERIQDGVERLTFAAGIPALQYIQQQDLKLKSLAEILDSPTEQIEQALKDLIDAHKSTRKELDKLRERIAKYEALELVKTAKPVGEIRVLKQKLERVDVETILKISNELVKTEPRLLSVIIGVDDKSAKIVVRCGSVALKNGANAGEVAAEIAGIMGGGGGGKPDFGQGGSEHPEKAQDALETVEKIVEKQIKK
jgi:alanyl-tRNA synthetase